MSTANDSDLISCLSINEYLIPGRFPPKDPLIEGFVSKSELCLLTAPAKLGKSWLAIQMATAVSTGGLFLEKYSTHQSTVLLLQTEVSDANFSERMQLFFSSSEFVPNPSDLFIANERIRIDSPEGLDKLQNTIEEINPGFLVLDPFYTLHRRDEDKSKDIAPILSDLREIIIHANIGCLLIHHQGKSKERGGQVGHKARGSSSFADVPDANIELSRTSEPNILKLSFEMRNIATPDPIKLQFDADRGRHILVDAPDRASERDSAFKLAEILEANGEMSRDALIAIFTNQANVRPRTAADRIK